MASVSASGPETDNPDMEETALQGMVTAPLPPPEEGWVENRLFPFLFVPQTIKNSAGVYLGSKRVRMMCHAMPGQPHLPLL